MAVVNTIIVTVRRATAAQTVVINRGPTGPAGPTGGGTELTSYVTQVESLGDYPATFPPDTHTHAQSEVTDLVGDLAGKLSTLANVTLDNGNLIDPHTYSFPDISGEFLLDSSLPLAQSHVVDLVDDLAAKAPKADPTFTGTVSLANLTASGTVSAANLTASGTVTGSRFVEGVTEAGIIGASANFASVATSVITATLTDGTPCTITLPTPAAGLSLIAHIKQAPYAPTTVSFAGPLWSGGTHPVMTATANKVDIFSFVTIRNADGSGWIWAGSAIQNITPT